MLRAGRDRGDELLPVRHHPQGLLPAAGHRHADRATCAPIRASRSRRWCRSCAPRWRSCSMIRRCRTWSASPAAVAAPGGGGNTANIFVGLKPLSQRKVNGDRIIARLRAQLPHMTGARLFLQAIQDIRAGGRQSNSQYQYTILGGRPDRAAHLDAEDHRGAQARAGARGRQLRSARTRAWTSRSTSIAPPRRGSASICPRSTTRCTTPSASARSRPSTTT